MIEVRCPGCGKSLQIPDQYAGQQGRCNGCGGAIAVPVLQPTPPPTVVTAPQQVPPRASIKLRVIAFLIDIVVLSFVVGPVLSLFGTQASLSEAFKMGGGILLSSPLILLIFLPYFAFMECSRYQATLGKIAMGIMVINVDGGRLSFKSSVWRHIVKSLLSFAWTFALLILWPLLPVLVFAIPWLLRKNNPFDRYTKTLVVLNPSGSSSSSEPSGTVVALNPSGSPSSGSQPMVPKVEHFLTKNRYISSITVATILICALLVFKDDILAMRDPRSAIGTELGLSALGLGKQSGVEGKLVDGDGTPVSGVTMRASQVQPIKGYEQVDVLTDTDGAFRLGGLYPSAEYVLRPWSSRWTCKIAIAVDTPPQGETALLPSPVILKYAFSTDDGSLIGDYARNAKRFTASSERVIKDTKTGLEWIVAPDQGANYNQAYQWVSECGTAGGGWRMPTREELRTLCVDQINTAGTKEEALLDATGLADMGLDVLKGLDPVFKALSSGGPVWAEPKDESDAWTVEFPFGRVDSMQWDAVSNRDGMYAGRVFGVRSAPPR